MIDYIKPSSSGYTVIYSYLEPMHIPSDTRFIQSLHMKKAENAISKWISTMDKNQPIFVHPNIIFYTLPHKQASIRYRLNLYEIYRLEYKNLCVEIHFYSGHRVNITNIKEFTFKRFNHIFRRLKEDISFHR